MVSTFTLVGYLDTLSATMSSHPVATAGPAWLCHREGRWAPLSRSSLSTGRPNTSTTGTGDLSYVREPDALTNPTSRRIRGSGGT